MGKYLSASEIIASASGNRLLLDFLKQQDKGKLENG